jgi:endonuclease/exonuclease/phosphatase family metal-dependent hydrolase
MKVLSCNIRTSRAQDGSNGWQYRKEICRDVIRRQLADVICFQEMTPEQFDYFRSAFSEFGAYWILDKTDGGEPVNTVFYRQNHFSLRSSGGYWLSETPHVSGSKSWQSDCIRLASWICLSEKESRRDLRIINTHLDHVSQEARENQARLINEDASAFEAGYPQLLTGDMNADSKNKTIQIFIESGWIDTYAALHGAEDPGPTAHGFAGPNAPEKEKGRIDWIFYRGRIEVISAEVIRESENGRYPSDHYFVATEVHLL